MRRLPRILFLLLSAALPAWLSGLSVEPPVDREIHVESFRYGKDPHVIRVNRGDRLHLTFSTRDTAHSFYLEEFDVDAKVTAGQKAVQVFSVAEPEKGGKREEKVTIVADPPGLLGGLTSRMQYRCHVWCGPMHAFESGNFVIRPNRLLWAGLGLIFAFSLLGLHGALKAKGTAPPPERKGVNLLTRFPWLGRLVKRRGFQFAFIVPGLLFLYIVILTSLFGVQMAGRNLGVMLLWVVWLFLLAALFTPLGGRAWCLACPLPVVGDVIQRRTLTGVRLDPNFADGPPPKFNNKFHGLNLPWPKALSNGWLRILSFLTLGTFSVVLVAKPAASGWVLLGMVVLAAVLAMIFELRAFCRYLCPIDSFVGLYGKAGKIALRPVVQETCDECKVVTCLKGSAKGWACPYGLAVRDIDVNDDCGLCTECIKTCPYDNVGVFLRPLAEERTVKEVSGAWLAVVMLVLSIAYTVVYLGPWPALRDMVNVLDKANWTGFAVYAAVVWSVALAGAPLLLLAGAAAGKALSRSPLPLKLLFVRSAGFLIPLGLALWTAFAVPMLTVNKTFVLQSVGDPFGWGWNLIGAAQSPWQQLWPSAIPWIQTALLLAGYGYALRNGFRTWHALTEKPRAALLGFLPQAGLMAALVVWLLFFYTN